jgi:hypothetical protein
MERERRREEGGQSVRDDARHRGIRDRGRDIGIAICLT